MYKARYSPAICLAGIEALRVLVAVLFFLHEVLVEFYAFIDVIEEFEFTVFEDGDVLAEAFDLCH